LPSRTLRLEERDQVVGGNAIGLLIRKWRRSPRFAEAVDGRGARPHRSGGGSTGATAAQDDAAMTDDEIRACLAGILNELEQLRRRDREHAAGETVLRDRVRELERKIKLLGEAGATSA
jgi:hypothetical protein